MPPYVLAALEDHIAPWQSCFKATHLYSGKKTCFALDQWGHIAGVVNTPDAGQYGFWTGELKAGESAEEWLSGAAQLEGSWWPDWQA